MATFMLPFEEHQRGWYEIEADSIEEAKAIVIAGDFTENHEPFYKDGVVEWDENDLIVSWSTPITNKEN
jgi:hypothetical protein